MIKCKNCNLETNQTPYCKKHLAEEYGLEVKKSNIHGYGLFNLKDRSRNEKICLYDGKRYQEPISGDYVLEYKNGYYIDCEETTTCCAGRFINDPRDPKKANARFSYNPKTNEVWIVSTKHIYPGQELLISYGYYSYWAKR